MKKALIYPASDHFDIICDDISSDKSISHRCAMFSLLSDKPSRITNFLQAEDTLNSLNIASMLGATVEKNGNTITITPPAKITEPSDILDCGNAGTGMRLYCGLLSSIDGAFVLTGDKYLRSRPMKRVVEPLKSIGAMIDGRENGNLAPLFIRGGNLKAFKYDSPIDSAQVKSALILAGLYADGISYYKEHLLSRDHTERMLKGMGVDISTNNDGWIEIHPISKPLEPLNITVPSDPSSGFFFAVAAAIVPNAKIRLVNMTLNPTRIEAYKILEAMGADIKYELKTDVYEPMGDIVVSYNGKLNGVNVSQNIAWLIDELPALSIAMACANGSSKVSNAKELRAKESDRISSVLSGLKQCEILCEEFEDGYEITGGELKRSTINSFGDHRVAMSFAIAGLLCGMEIEDIDCINTSFPNFFDILEKITKVEK